MANRHAGVQEPRQCLWEVRTDLSSNRTARLLFFLDENRIGVVHGLIKKTRKTPDADIGLALRRVKEMKS